MPHLVATADSFHAQQDAPVIDQMFQLHSNRSTEFISCTTWRSLLHLDPVVLISMRTTLTKVKNLSPLCLAWARLCPSKMLSNIFSDDRTFKRALGSFIIFFVMLLTVNEKLLTVVTPLSQRKSVSPLSEKSNVHSAIAALPEVTRRVPKVWISMSVCWSSNVQIHNKENFPYTLAAELSVNLWRTKTDHSVMVQVVHDVRGGRSHEDGKFDAYLRRLQSSGAVVLKVLNSSKNMSCPLTSQVSHKVKGASKSCVCVGPAPRRFKIDRPILIFLPRLIS